MPAFCAIIILGSHMEHTCISVESLCFERVVNSTLLRTYEVMMDSYPVQTKKSNKYKSGFKRLKKVPTMSSSQLNKVITV